MVIQIVQLTTVSIYKHVPKHFMSLTPRCPLCQTIFRQFDIMNGGGGGRPFQSHDMYLMVVNQSLLIVLIINLCLKFSM